MREETRGEGTLFETLKSFQRTGFKTHKQNTSNTELLPRPKSTSPEWRDKKADDCREAGVDRQGLKLSCHVSHLFLPTCLK